MTADERRAFDLLIDQFWCGQCSQVDFFEVGAAIGASEEQLNQVLTEVQEEDGTWF